jgi:predicted ArsR family transcriptional regulator
VSHASGGTKQRIVEHLQTVTSATAPDLARLMGISDAAMRQHLEQLQSDGVVRRDAPDNDVRPRGRPAVRWVLDRGAATTDGFASAFPDRHDDLALDLIAAVRAELGDAGVERVLARRGAQQSEHYRRRLGGGTLAERVTRLAALRDAEGYRAEAVACDDGSFVLAEHHCPIDSAARACGALCESELAVFRSSLGTTVSVQRLQHAPSGDGRCSYRISTTG